MELTVLGSSSKGNGYVLQNQDEALVIECGVPLLDVKKAVDFNISKIAGVLVSHEHGDHAKFVNDFLKARIKVIASEGTCSKLKITKGTEISYVEPGLKFHLGNFTILPFGVKHDAAEPFGFLISHPEIGVLLFATDTYYLPYRFAGLTNVMIECNYRKDILENRLNEGKIHFALYNRTLESHMSYDTCRDALLANDLSKVNNIILIHLSDGNSNAEEFVSDLHRATGKTVVAAEKGLKIKLNKTPF